MVSIKRSIAQMIKKKKSNRIFSKKESIRYLFVGPIFILTAVLGSYWLIPQAIQSGKVIEYKQALIPESGFIMMMMLFLFITGACLTSTAYSEYRKYKQDELKK